MPFKRMTVREQIAAKRELKRLRTIERQLQQRYGGTQIATGELCDFAGGAIRAALALGFIVVVRAHSSHDKKLVASAYKLGDLG